MVNSAKRKYLRWHWSDDMGFTVDAYVVLLQMDLPSGSEII